MTTDLIAAVDTAKRAVRAASRLCMQVADRGTARLEKGGREPVTLADYGSQAVILGLISAEFPGHAVLAEEGAAHLLDHSDGGIRSDLAALVATVTGGACTIDDLLARIDHAGGEGLLVWAVDPIDGTKGFLRGDQFAVAVGLLEGARPVAGVLGCPRLSIGETSGVLVWGGPGVGAFVEPIAGGDARSVRVSEVADPAGVRVLGSVETSHGDPAIIERAVAAAGLGGGWMRIDSQAKYAAVAAGLAETYIRPRNRKDWRERAWDHAAGAAIVAGAGGRVTDLDGRDLDFSAGATLENNRGVLATNGLVHDLMLEVLG